MKFYPLKLTPEKKSIIWGGNQISEKFDIGEKGESIAEAWMLTVRPDGVNIIDNGEYAGMTLSEYIEKAGSEKVYGKNEFPLLIKIIDAEDKLSVQVHPDDAYAHSHGLDAGKTEMWYILDAKPGAKLVAGIKEGATPEIIAKTAESGELENYLNYVPVKKGDCFFIPAGLVHAIGSGILIAEIQQNSNTTYRLYDYDRRDKNGNKRELHIESACEVIKEKFDLENTHVNEVVYDKDGVKVTLLCGCEFFSAKNYEMKKGSSVSINTDGKMLHLMCTSGHGYIECNGEKYSFKMGDSYLVPCYITDFVMASENDCEVIASTN